MALGEINAGPLYFSRLKSLQEMSATVCTKGFGRLNSSRTHTCPLFHMLDSPLTTRFGCPQESMIASIISSSPVSVLKTLRHRD